MNLPKYIKIQKPTLTLDDQGGTVETLANYWSGWGKVEEMSWKQSLEYGQPTSNRTIKVIVRKNGLTEDINGSYKLIYRGVDYDIVQAPREITPFYIEILASCRLI